MSSLAGCGWETERGRRLTDKAEKRLPLFLSFFPYRSRAGRNVKKQSLGVLIQLGLRSSTAQDSREI